MRLSRSTEKYRKVVTLTHCVIEREITLNEVVNLSLTK